jgi:hypothetical protein
MLDEGKVNERYLDRMVDETALVTSITLDHPVPHEVLTDAQARERFAKDVDRELSPGEARSMVAALRAFGFVKEAFDLRALETALYAEQAAAFYDPIEKKFFFIDKDQPGGFMMWFACWVTNRDLPNEMVVTHEMTHALQDRAYDLQKYLDAARSNDDAALARTAVVEGQAVYYSFKAMGLREDIELTRADLLDAPGEAMEKAPPVLRELLIFPYWAGLSFTQRTAAPGFGAKAGVVVDPWLRPPASTAEILHPGRYKEGTPPPTISFPEPALDAGWKIARENTLGAFLSGILVGRDDTFGWLGDRYRVYEDASGRLALAWALVFESDTQAETFVQDHRAYQAKKGVKYAATEQYGRWVGIAEAPDEATFRALRDSAWRAH